MRESPFRWLRRLVIAIRSRFLALSVSDRAKYKAPHGRLPPAADGIGVH